LALLSMPKLLIFWAHADSPNLSGNTDVGYICAAKKRKNYLKAVLILYLLSK